MHGCIIEQDIDATCYSSVISPSYLDYWVMHEGLQGLVLGEGPDLNSPLPTHLTLKAVMTRAPMKAEVKRIRVPEDIPIKTKAEWTWDICKNRAVGDDNGISESSKEIAEAILTSHPQEEAMIDLNQQLSRWANATELQQLSGTEMQIEDWRKYMGRCRLPVVKYQHPDLGYLSEFGDEGCRKSWLWWAATNKIIRVATAGWTMKIGE